MKQVLVLFGEEIFNCANITKWYEDTIDQSSLLVILNRNLVI